MLKTDSFVVCLSLRTGVMFIGYLGIVTSSLVMWGSIFTIGFSSLNRQTFVEFIQSELKEHFTDIELLAVDNEGYINCNELNFDSNLILNLSFLVMYLMLVLFAIICLAKLLVSVLLIRGLQTASFTSLNKSNNLT